MDDFKYWLILNHCPGIGPSTFFKLLEHCGSIEALFKASCKQKQKWNLPQKTRDFLNSDTEIAIEKDLQWQQQSDCHILPYNHADYPPLLREIPDPPLVLYVQGNPTILSQPQLAIVGSRNPTAQGKENAQIFSSALANAGLIITSGMALGIDGASHQGALSVQQPTIAVVGTGLDRVYPARHQQLAHDITAHGAIVSEYAIGTGVRAGHFPRRNRIISGLSLGVLVIEAAIKSGSLISARLAMEQGREVFAIPGSIHNTLARGCHLLIKQGAKLVETADDVVEELSAMALFGQKDQQLNATANRDCHQNSSINNSNVHLDTDQQTVLAAIDYSLTTVDQIIDRTDCTTELVSGTLLILELEGLITSATGGYCKRA